MLTLNRIREERDRVEEGLRKRNFTDESLKLLDTIIDLDNLRKKTQAKLDELLSNLNNASKKIGDLYKLGQRDEAEKEKELVSAIKQESKEYEDILRQTISELEERLITLPNIPHESVVQGKTPEDNEVYRAWEKAFPEIGKNPLPHWDLARKYNLLDFELGNKLTGSGFPVYRGKGARLQRALISFFLDRATLAGYEEIIPPYLVNADTARATGQLPDKEGQMYHCTVDDLYLIPTAEVPVTNIYRDCILSESDFPIKLTAYTPCFRREAGSYGADVKGLNRVHQFDKVEIVQIAHPQHSYETLQEMLDHVSNLLTDLELPFRILRLCGGDMGFTSALTYDFEVFSAAQQRWLEVSSVSNFETFQSNRLKLRYKDNMGLRQLAHTLNGSALALARIVAALLENNQSNEGIRIPKVLIPYTGFELIN